MRYIKLCVKGERNTGQLLLLEDKQNLKQRESLECSVTNRIEKRPQLRIFIRPTS